MHGEQSSDRWNVSFTAIIRVTLRDGTFHEDVGSGHAENVKGKAAALAKVGGRMFRIGQDRILMGTTA